MNCRLCLSNNELSQITGIDEREYYLCENCKLINVHPDFFPDKIQEKERYLTHQNGIQYTGYVTFLSRAMIPY
jgi:hypothetical protein